MINSIVNKFKFPNGQVKEYGINVISLKMLSQGLTGNLKNDYGVYFIPYEGYGISSPKV